jgi:hypothetical protein
VARFFYGGNLPAPRRQPAAGFYLLRVRHADGHLRGAAINPWWAAGTGVRALHAAHDHQG